MTIQTAVVGALPNKEAVGKFSIAFVAMVLVSIVGAQVASLWFAGSDQRECFALRQLVGEIAGRLALSPERTVRCDRVRDVVMESGTKIVQSPVLSKLSSTIKFSEDIEKFVEKAVKDYCVNGVITYGDVAKALRAEMVRRCG